MPLYHLIYFSKRAAFDQGSLSDILASSRKNNARHDVTGALFVHAEYFFQILEGPRNILSQLLFRLMSDERHTDVTVTLCEELNYRMFGEWHMMILDQNASEVRRVYDKFAKDVRSPELLSGNQIWDMMEQMSQALLADADRQNISQV